MKKYVVFLLAFLFLLVGFINEASFFDHLHRFHGMPFETIPIVVLHNGPQFFSLGSNTL
jgi:hypothetical protein